MAKAASKAPVKKVKKKAAPKKTAVSSSELIMKACELALGKLNELNIEHELQSDINWCLGSFRNDQNPVGLYEMTEKSLVVFRAELGKKTKGVTPKLIADIEKALGR